MSKIFYKYLKMLEAQFPIFIYKLMGKLKNFHFLILIKFNMIDTMKIGQESD